MIRLVAVNVLFIQAYLNYVFETKYSCRQYLWSLQKGGGEIVLPFSILNRVFIYLVISVGTLSYIGITTDLFL